MNLSPHEITIGSYIYKILYNFTKYLSVKKVVNLTVKTFEVRLVFVLFIDFVLDNGFNIIIETKIL